ncbi:retrovirus-related pol polyprotein from transposon TNT 1-94 [Tanacetum coccineum]
MTLDIHNWSSSTHQEIYKIIKDEIFPIVYQVDARVQNFKIQFLKESAKFVRDFQSLANEADESLAKHKALELEIEHLLRAVENEYAKLWNDWYKKCEECKYDKISYDKAYNDMQQKIERLQAQLGDQKGKNQLFDKVSEQKDTTHETSANTKFAKQSSLGIPPSSSRPKMYDVTLLPKSTAIPKIDPSNTSRENKFVPIHNVRASIWTNLITMSKPHVISKKVVNSDSNGFSSTGVDITTKNRRPHPRSNIKNDKVPSASQSSCIKNKEVKVEEHHKNLKPMSSECNNIKLAIRNDKSEVVCAMCKKFLITANHDVCVLTYVNDMNSRDTKQSANVSNIENQKKQKPKFLETIRFGNDHIAAIMGYGDLQWRNILITRVYFVEGLVHNLFSVGRFCDSDLEVAFRRNTCYVQNLEGVDLLKGNRTTNLYTINLHEMASASLICLVARATSTKSCLWHQRSSHLNFDTINDLARNDLITGLPKFKYHKEHLCHSCEQGKSKKVVSPTQTIPNSKQRLHLLHMDLCGPMRVESINGKQYVLVIVEDYSRYTWVHFLRSKDEAPEVIRTFLKKITVLLQAPDIIVRTDNDTEFKNQVLQEYFDSAGISHQTSSVRTPQQIRVVEHRNRTLVEATRTMLIFSCALLFLWAEAIATACYTQNRSIIHRRFNKTPYELINGRKLDISFLHVFGALYYPKNDREDLGKLGAKGDIGFFIGYSTNSCAFRVYNQRTKKIMETMNVTFDELSASNGF